MTREQKITAVRSYANDLMELAVAYRDAAGIADILPDETLDAMYATSVDGNRIHNDIANELVESE